MRAEHGEISGGGGKTFSECLWIGNRSKDYLFFLCVHPHFRWLSGDRLERSFCSDKTDLT